MSVLCPQWCRVTLCVMPTNTSDTMGKRLRRLRESQSPKLSVDALTVKTCMQLPEAMWISSETIRRIESGQTPEAAVSPLLVVAMAEVLGCKVGDISPTAAEELESIRALVNRSSECITAASGHAA